MNDPEQLPDPYQAFFDWCLANGFRDVAECEPEDVDVRRMDEAIARYALANREASLNP